MLWEPAGGDLPAADEHTTAGEELGLGLLISVVAALVNGGVAVVLLRAGRKYNSITLRADGHRLMTDLITSVGVVVGIGLVRSASASTSCGPVSGW